MSINCQAVIVTYNRLELLKECLNAVLKQTVPFQQIIIVNNACTDGTSEFLEGFKQNPKFRIVEQEENTGGAGGFYSGLALAKQSSADWVLLIDDDAILRPDYMEQLLTYAANHPDHAALAGAVYVNGQIDINHRRRLDSKLFFVEHAMELENYERRSFACDCGTFCGMLISGRALQQIGLPRKMYYIWYDDTEYSLRLGEFQCRRFPGLEEMLGAPDHVKKKNGYAGIMVIPEAILDHKTSLPPEGMGLLERTTWRHYYGYRNRMDTAKMHFGKGSAIMICIEYLGLLLLSVLSCLLPSKREHAIFNIHMIRAALKDGWHGRLGKNPDFLP